LIIPRAPALLLASLPDSDVPAVERRPTADVAAISNPAPEAAPATAASLTYRVKRGDTLFSIAKLFRTSVASLKTWNGLRTNSIKVGQRLTIFTSSNAAAATN
jgi:membrane-bound lytic murein transglycosylase D